MAHRHNGQTAAALALSALLTIGCSDSTPAPTRATAPVTPAVAATSGEETAPVMAPALPSPASFADGETAYAAGNYGEATRIFERYAGARPENAWGQFMLGLSSWKAGEPGRAEMAFVEALRLDPDHVKSLLNLSRVLIEQGRSAEAVEKLARAGELEPSSGEVHRLLGRAHAAQRQAEEAIAAYRHALELDEADTWAMNNLGLIFLEQGRPGEALPLLARAAELGKDVPVFHNNLGMALEHTGDFAGAAAAYGGALAAAPDYEKAQKNLARVEQIKLPKEPADLAQVPEPDAGETVKSNAAESASNTQPTVGR